MIVAPNNTEAQKAIEKYYCLLLKSRIMSARVAIVGAGISGASCAYALRAAGGVDVTMFDMGRRGPGMSSSDT
jgi:predicted NAD/FAD-binding protein